MSSSGSGNGSTCQQGASSSTGSGHGSGDGSTCHGSSSGQGSGQGSTCHGSSSGSGSGSGSGCSCTFCNAGTQAAIARGAQNANGAGAPDRSPCLPQGPTQNGTFPATRPLELKEKVLLYAALAETAVIPGLSSVIFALNIGRQYANANNCTVAIGAQSDAMGIVGGSAGFGLYCGPGDDWGVYGTFAVNMGAAVGLSAEVTFTIVNGPSSALGGNCLALCGGGGEAVVVSGSLLFTLDGKFLGVSGSVGIGGGWPIGVFVSYQHTEISTPS